MTRILLALSGISLMVALTGCCCGSQCCGYGGGGCPNGACGVPGGPVYQQGAFLPGTTIQAAIPAQPVSAVVRTPSTYSATTTNYPATAMVDSLPTY